MSFDPSQGGSGYSSVRLAAVSLQFPAEQQR
jgi:hypothetical protein